MRGFFVFCGLIGTVLAACGGSTTAGHPASDAGSSADAAKAATDAASTSDAASSDAGALIDSSDDGWAHNPCVATFGTGLSAVYGRIDGTLRAIVRPYDQQCAMPNHMHCILEIEQSGSVYRLLINVQSDVDGIDPRVGFAEADMPPPGAPWAEGWHTGVAIDYPTLGIHDTAFTLTDLDPLVTKIVQEVTIGDPITVYATGFGPDGGHDIHRNGGGDDGLVVIHPKAALAHVLAFRFSDQSF